MTGDYATTLNFRRKLAVSKNTRSLRLGKDGLLELRFIQDNGVFALFLRMLNSEWSPTDWTLTVISALGQSLLNLLIVRFVLQGVATEPLAR